MDLSFSGTQKAKKKRVRNWTAEDRALHREFEKSRREAFSERLTELTSLLPMLNSEQRPSKHVIVDASISYHRVQEERSHQAACVIQDLISERDDLLRELNTLRSLCQPGDCVPRQPRPIDPAVVAMLADTRPTVIIHGQRAAISDTILPQTSASIATSDIISFPVQAPGHDLPPLTQPTYNADDWEWSNSPKAEPVHFPSNNMRSNLAVWETSPDMAIVTPPKEMGLGYETSPSHLINDSAFFWTQHSGLDITTPPGDSDIQYNANSTMIPNDLPFPLSQDTVNSAPASSTSEEATFNNQNFQLANPFANPR
ncbi:hypothetical protein N7450_010681 [Penicillium hetheringtonii]|nr:hypothetical protein N7450_010681 [Penicillium hetheringtonii]